MFDRIVYKNNAYQSTITIIHVITVDLILVVPFNIIMLAFP